MKKLKASFLLFLAALLFSGCDLIPLKPGVWKNEKIDKSKREDLRELNDKFIKALENNKLDEVENMVSGNMIEHQYKRKIEIAYNHIKQGSYKLNTEYYMVNQLRHGEFIKPNTDTTDLDYNAISKEMYIACFLPKTGDNKYMVTAVYGKFDYGWKIEDIEVNPYTINGKNAFELYQQAKKQFSKGYFIPAYITMQQALLAARPADEVKNPNDLQMSRFNADVMNAADANFKMPLVLSNMLTHPVIIKIFNQRIDEGTFPTIYYISKIDIQDIPALTKEHEEVKRNIGKLLPGIDKEYKYILYSVFNKTPNGGRTSSYYNFTDKVN